MKTIKNQYSSEQLIEMWNEYIESNATKAPKAFINSDDGIELSGVTQRDLIISARFGKYDFNHRFFNLDEFGKPMSYENIDEVIDLNILEQWIKKD